MSFVDSIKKDFSLIAILLIPIAVAINSVGGSLALALKLPVYLDSIGTFLVAILAGPWLGAITGTISLLVVSAGDVSSLPWTIVACLMGMVVGFLAKGKFFTGIVRIVLAVVIIVVGSVLLTIIVRVVFFGGYSGHIGSVFAGTMVSSGVPFWVAQFVSSFFLELPDKVLSVIIPLLVVGAMSDRYLLKFSLGHLLVDARKARKAKADRKASKNA